MKIKILTLFALLCLAGSLPAGPVSLEPGEVLQLRALVATNSAAAAQFAPIREAADRSLGEQPDPIVKVVSEGHLEKDPRKVRSKAAMNDRGKIASLAWAWAATDDKRYAVKAREFLIAWARVNQSDGDAINETQFEPMIVAYDLLRGSFSGSDRQTVDDWLRTKAEILWQSPKGTGGNWYSHRLKIVGLIGLTLGDDSLIQRAMEGYHRQIRGDLRPDGSSTDFHVRDAMHYHLYSIEPLLTLAQAAERHGDPLFDYQAANGASLQSAVEFVVPFADGTKTHIEFANTKTPFDHERARNGEKEYQPHPWDPKASIDMFSEAAWFEPHYGALAARLAGRPEQTFVNWRMVINAVAPRPAK